MRTGKFRAALPGRDPSPPVVTSPAAHRPLRLAPSARPLRVKSTGGNTKQRQSPPAGGDGQIVISDPQRTTRLAV